MTVLRDFSGVARRRFIETGTNEGNTLALAIPHFDELLSVEQNAVLFENAVERFKFYPSVTVCFGDSPKFLRDVIDANVPTTFWLDAHYFGNANSLCKTGKQCPLLDELGVIVLFAWQTPPIILIDDAFMFDDSINAPGSNYPFWKSNESGHDIYRRSEWPRIEEVDFMLDGYRKTMREDYVLQYERA